MDSHPSEGGFLALLLTPTSVDSYIGQKKHADLILLLIHHKKSVDFENISPNVMLVSDYLNEVCEFFKYVVHKSMSADGAWRLCCCHQLVPCTIHGITCLT